MRRRPELNLQRISRESPFGSEFDPRGIQVKEIIFWEMEALLCHFDETTSAILTTDEDVISCFIHYREILQEMELVNDKMRKQVDDFYTKTDDLRKQKMYWDNQSFRF